jgi:hypothetical protein
MYFVASLDFVFEYLKQPTFKNIGDIHRHSKFAAHLTTKEDLMTGTACFRPVVINLLNAKLNPICQMLALLRAHHIFHISGVRVNAHMKLESWH